MPREVREVVFVDGVRTPFGKAGGMYAETRADDLVVAVGGDAAAATASGIRHGWSAASTPRTRSARSSAR